MEVSKPVSKPNQELESPPVLYHPGEDCVEHKNYSSFKLKLLVLQENNLCSAEVSAEDLLGIN